MGIKGVYHEKQSLQMCALHALNNLLQRKAFNKRKLDDIISSLLQMELQQFENAQEISWWSRMYYRYFALRFNSHKSFLGTGNYDINVIDSALRSEGLELQWFDKRKDVSTIEYDSEEMYGIVVNIRYRYWFTLKSKHWFSLKKLEDFWYNLDSKLDGPSPFTSVDQVQQFLRDCCKNNEAEILLVKRVSPSH